jgi:hypothetical protein
MLPLPVGLATAVGLLCLAETHRGLEARTDLEARRARASLLRTGGALLWPALLLSVVPREDHCRWALAPALLFNFAVWTLDSYLLHRVASSEPEARPASLRLDASSVTGLTFGLCGLLGARPDGKYTYLFLYAIVGCIVLVLPSHNLQPGCVEEQIFESVQKAAIVWCLGLLIAGIALTRADVVSPDGGCRR